MHGFSVLMSTACFYNRDRDGNFNFELANYQREPGSCVKQIQASLNFNVLLRIKNFHTSQNVNAEIPCKNADNYLEIFFLDDAGNRNILER